MMMASFTPRLVAVALLHCLIIAVSPVAGKRYLHAKSADATDELDRAPQTPPCEWAWLGGARSDGVSVRARVRVPEAVDLLLLIEPLDPSSGAAGRRRLYKPSRKTRADAVRTEPKPKGVGGDVEVRAQPAYLGASTIFAWDADGLRAGKKHRWSVVEHDPRAADAPPQVCRGGSFWTPPAPGARAAVTVALSPS